MTCCRWYRGCRCERGWGQLAVCFQVGAVGGRASKQYVELSLSTLERARLILHLIMTKPQIDQVVGEPLRFLAQPEQAGLGWWQALAEHCQALLERLAGDDRGQRGRR